MTPMYKKGKGKVNTRNKKYRKTRKGGGGTADAQQSPQSTEREFELFNPDSLEEDPAVTNDSDALPPAAPMPPMPPLPPAASAAAESPGSPELTEQEVANLEKFYEDFELEHRAKMDEECLNEILAVQARRAARCEEARREAERQREEACKRSKEIYEEEGREIAKRMKITSEKISKLAKQRATLEASRSKGAAAVPTTEDVSKATEGGFSRTKKYKRKRTRKQK
jgi:hypothetical protein